MSQNKCCFGCLSKDGEVSLHFYKVQIEAIKAIFQGDCISFCYLCKRKAQQAELFIQNVQSNQILLEKFHNISDPTLDSIKGQIVPLTNLTIHCPLDVVEIGGNEDACIEESFSVVSDSSKDTKIKLELKDEELFEQLEGEFIGDDNVTDDLDSYVKEEDEYPLKLLKEELELEGIKIKCLRKPIKTRRVKKKCAMEKKKEIKKVNELKDLRLETINITREQCMEERAVMASDKKYINSVFKCQDCIKGFNFKASYDKHMEKHSELNGHYECDICKQRLISAEKLHRHQRYHTLRYKCSECDLMRISRLTIKDHYTAFHCHGFYQYKCQQCPKVFKRQVSLRKHVLYIHRSKERVQCAYCDKSYKTKEVLKAHLIVRHPAEVSAGTLPKRHVCDQCGMAFNAPSQLRNHSVKHSHTRDYYCVECDKSFKSDSTLKQHLKTAMPHVNNIELPLACQHCDKRFAVRRDVERHTNRVHLNVKPYQCDQCDKAYTNDWSLKEHKQYTHEGRKRPLKFPCQMCKKVFDRKQILKSHIRTHTGERPFQCSKCPAQFSQASILGTHFKLIHLKLTRDGRPKGAALK